jgi:hypothetical protein
VTRRVLTGWAIEDSDGVLIGLPDVDSIKRQFEFRDDAMAEANWPGYEPDRALIHYRVTIEQIERIPLKSKGK